LTGSNSAAYAGRAECLVTHGYSGTTTQKVAEIAGVTRGAQVHRFVDRVCKQLRGMFVEAFGAKPIDAEITS